MSKENFFMTVILLTRGKHEYRLRTSVVDAGHNGTDPDPWICTTDLRILLFSSNVIKSHKTVEIKVFLTLFSL
jgi:hypothetical protein